jgi:hypothetical protein
VLRLNFQRRYRDEDRTAGRCHRYLGGTAHDARQVLEARHFHRPLDERLGDLDQRCVEKRLHWTVTVIWDESVYPWQELAVIDIEKTLDWEESLLTTFSVKNMPKTLGVLPANSIYDYNSLNYMRAHSELARKARLLSYKLFGLPPPIPDNDNRNVSGWGE